MMYEDGFSNTLQDLDHGGSHQTLAMESLVCSALLDLQPSFIIFTDTVQTLPAFFHFTIWLLSKHIYPHTNRHTPHNTNFSRHSHVLFYNIESWQIVPQSGICLWAWGNRECRSDECSLCYGCVPYHLIDTDTRFLQNNSFTSNSRKKNLHRCRAEHV